MKVAVSATGPSLQAEVDPRFGRCPSFVLVETENLSFEAVPNRSASLAGGAGIQSAQLMVQRGVKAVLTGHCGPNAQQALSAAGIQVVDGCSGTVAEVVERFTSDTVRPAQPDGGRQPTRDGEGQ
jgi:predicted Fe-Mo cluster-binding NifX family protein